MPYSIMLDAGHGGKDPGAVSAGRQEKDDTLRLTLMVGEILQDRGVDVEYTRTTDIYETPVEKAMEANAAGVDYFVSIHRNSTPDEKRPSGVESLVYDLSGVKYEMAQDINEQLEAVGFVNRGVQARPNLAVLRRTKMPAVLVEVGFINSDTDNQLLDENMRDIAEAIAEGILDTLEYEGELGGGTAGTSQGGPHYRVQAGAYRNRTYAQRLMEELMEYDIPAYIDDSGPFYLVQIGDYRDLDEAAAMEQRVKRAGYPAVIVKLPS